MGLGSLFLAVVLAENALLAAVYAVSPALPETQDPQDYRERKAKRVRRVIDIMRNLRTAPAPAPSPESRATAPDTFAFDWLPEPVLTGGEEVAEMRRPEPPSTRAKEPVLAVGPLSGRFSMFDHILRKDVDPAVARTQLAEDWSIWSLKKGLVVEALDDVFVLPASLCDGVVEIMRGCFPPTGCYSMQQEDERPMIERLMLLRDFGPERSPFGSFIERWVEREQRLFGGGDSYLLTFGVAEGLEPVDSENFAYEQRKILLDVVRRTYFTRYFGRADERLRNDAWRFSEWKAVDLLVAPPLLAAYTWFRGWERRIRLLGTQLSVKVEPPADILEKRQLKDDLVSALGVEWEVPGVPVKLIVSAGLNDGEFGMDFVGIGTSLGAAKQAVTQVMHDVEGEPGER